MIAKLINMIKLARVSQVPTDDTPYPRVQISFNGKAKDAALLMPYGVSYRPRTDDLATCFNILGQESSIMAMPGGYLDRFKNLKPGELAVGSYKTRSRTFYDDAGNATVIGTENAGLQGATVFVGSESVNLLEKISDSLEEVSGALDHIANTATYPTSVGPTGTMSNPTPVVDAKNAIDTLKADIDSITGSYLSVD